MVFLDLGCLQCILLELGLSQAIRQGQFDYTSNRWWIDPLVNLVFGPMCIELYILYYKKIRSLLHCVWRVIIYQNDVHWPKNIKMIVICTTAITHLYVSAAMESPLAITLHRTQLSIVTKNAHRPRIEISWLNLNLPRVLKIYLLLISLYLTDSLPFNNHQAYSINWPLILPFLLKIIVLEIVWIIVFNLDYTIILNHVNFCTLIMGALNPFFIEVFKVASDIWKKLMLNKY